MMEIPLVTTDAEMCQTELESFNQMSGPVL